MFIKSQFTINIQILLYLNQRPPTLGSCEWFNSHQTCVGEASLYFQLELHTSGFLSVPKTENLKI